jgi:hypothetical protein
MGRRKRDGNHSSPKNNLIQDSKGNEENRYPVPDSNKTKINDAKVTNKTPKNTLKKEILQVITETLPKLAIQHPSKSIKFYFLSISQLEFLLYIFYCTCPCLSPQHLHLNYNDTL